METLLKVQQNPNGRDFVVGDLHGHLAQLKRQLADIRFNPGCDRLFFLGDVIDRGPDSEALLALIDQKSFLSIIGNHEAMMISGFEERERASLHQFNGGEWFYRIPAPRQRAIVDQVRSWPWAMELDSGDGCIGLVHANVPQSSWETVRKYLQSVDADWRAGSPLSETSIEYAAQRLLWDRTLVLRLYSEILATETNQQQLAEYLLQPHVAGGEWSPRSSEEQLRPFRIAAIDGVYMGHTFVPVALQVGNCHFLDTYREAQGEQLSIVQINGNSG